ncbi:prealbumin-like fold domain-containing protein, partial [Clostridium perfringens]
VTCTEGLDKGKSFEFVSTDKEQEFTLKAGKYEYVETQAPKGYELNKEVGKFEITKEGQVVKCEVKDKAT